MTKIMLCGMTDKPIDELAPLARSWLRPAKLTADSTAFANEGYDPTQRAYILACREPGKPSSVTLRLAATGDSPMANLALLVRDWGEQDAQLALDGEPIPRGQRFRFGHNRRLEGTDLIVWLEAQSALTAVVTLAPVPK